MSDRDRRRRRQDGLEDDSEAFEERPGEVGPLEEAPPIAVREAQAERLAKAWETPNGWRYWSAVNNSEVGAWYTTVAFFFFIFGGILALLMRTQLAVPENDFLSADLYNQVFSLHGSVMMFLFAVPIFEAFSISSGDDGRPSPFRSAFLV